MSYNERKVVYFTHCGESNTDRVLMVARTRCEELGIKSIVIASETGRSALKALDVFRGCKTHLIVVTHYPAATWGPKGKIPIGLGRSEYRQAYERLVEAGVVIVQGTRPLAPPTRSLDWKSPTPEAILDRTLEVFGAGTKIAIEVSIMATDAGHIDEGEEVVSCAGTFKGLDTALLVRTAYSMNFFKSFVVKEVIAKPSARVVGLPEYEDGQWKGSLEDYPSEKGPPADT